MKQLPSLRVPVLLVLVAATTSAGLAAAGTAPAGVTPLPGNTACRPGQPHVIGSGRAPRAPLRLDLGGIAHHSQTVHEVETFARRQKLLDGRWHATTAIRKILIVLKGGAISGDRVALSTTNTTSFPATKTTAAGKGGTFRLEGTTDVRSGGFFGGSAGNDRLPEEALGIGATWSVVTCDPVDSDVPAKQVRSYTLRSLAGGTAVLSYREVVSMDAAHRDLGTQTIAGTKARLRLDRLHGTTAGTFRLPVGRALAAESTQVTRVELTYHVVATNIPTTPIVLRLVDSRKDRAS